MAVSDLSITVLGTLAVDTAARAARVWFDQHPEFSFETDTLVACLRSNVKIRMERALIDAREALDAGMGDAAISTFKAEMALAGIDAAKEAFQV